MMQVEVTGLAAGDNVFVQDRSGTTIADGFAESGSVVFCLPEYDGEVLIVVQNPGVIKPFMVRATPAAGGKLLIGAVRTAEA